MLLIVNNPDCEEFYAELIESYLREDDKAPKVRHLVVQGSIEVVEGLKSTFRSYEVLSFGSQKRTIEELVYFASCVDLTFSDFALLAEQISDSHKAEILLAASQLKRAIKNLNQQIPGNGREDSLAELSKFITSHRGRAKDLSVRLSYFLECAERLYRIEDCFFSGDVSDSPGTLSSSRWHAFAHSNGLSALHIEYQALVKQWTWSNTLLEERRQASHRMRGGLVDLTAHSAFDFLTFLSAYSYSQSLLRPHTTDAITSFLWIYRSFEFGILALAVKANKVQISGATGRLEFFFSSGRAQGAGWTYKTLRDDGLFGDEYHSSMQSMISLRNASFVGHSWLHVSDENINFLRSDLRHFFIKNYDPNFNIWKNYQSTTRPLRLGAFFEAFLKRHFSSF